MHRRSRPAGPSSSVPRDLLNDARRGLGKKLRNRGIERRGGAERSIKSGTNNAGVGENIRTAPIKCRGLFAEHRLRSFSFVLSSRRFLRLAIVKQRSPGVARRIGGRTIDRGRGVGCSEETDKSTRRKPSFNYEMRKSSAVAGRRGRPRRKQRERELGVHDRIPLRTLTSSYRDYSTNGRRCRRERCTQSGSVSCNRNGTSSTPRVRPRPRIGERDRARARGPSIVRLRAHRFDECLVRITAFRGGKGRKKLDRVGRPMIHRPRIPVN